MNNILHKPLKPGVWRITAICILSFVSICIAGPWFYGAVQWTIHPSITVQSIKLRLPFGWIQDKSSFIFTVDKPWPSALTGIESRLTVRKDDIPSERNADVFAAWDKLHSDIGTWIKDEDIVVISKNGPHRLQCAKHVASNLWGASQLECISSDAKWKFAFYGQASDINEARHIVQLIVDNATMVR